IEHAAGRVEAVTGLAGQAAFEIRCDAAVLAAGVWSEGGAGPTAPPGIPPVQGELGRLIWAAPGRDIARSPGRYLGSRRGGELLVGATMEEQGLDAMPTAGAVLDLLGEAWRLLPAIYDLALTEVSVGFRPAVRDHLPVIGASSPRGLYVATGHFRNGVLLAPATAHHLADWIVTGAAPAALAPFGVERLVSQAVAGMETPRR